MKMRVNIVGLLYETFKIEITSLNANNMHTCPVAASVKEQTSKLLMRFERESLKNYRQPPYNS